VKPPLNSLPRILSSGIDTLYLAINLTWENDYDFNEEVQKKSVRLRREKIKSQEATSARAENGFPCTKPSLRQPALEQELKSQPRRLPTGPASEKPTCHRQAGHAKKA